MSLNEVLGWVTTLMATLGLTVFITAALVILLVVTMIDRFFHKG